MVSHLNDLNDHNLPNFINFRKLPSSDFWDIFQEFTCKYFEISNIIFVKSLLI
jgi:hypothetical protein